MRNGVLALQTVPEHLWLDPGMHKRRGLQTMIKVDRPWRCCKRTPFGRVPNSQLLWSIAHEIHN